MLWTLFADHHPPVQAVAGRARPRGRVAVSALVLLFSGCKVTDAPDTLEDLVVYAFGGFDDPDVRAEVGASVFDLAERNEDALVDGLRVTGLTTLDIEAAGVDAPPVDGIVGAVGQIAYTHDLDGVLRAATWPARWEIYDHTTSFEIVEATDLECFLSQACETFEMEADEGASVPLLGESTRRLIQQYAWVTGPSGAPFVLGRSLVPGGVLFNTDLVRVDQQYAVQVLWDVQGSARRLETFWVEAEFIGLDVPDAYAVNEAVGEMAKYAEEVDAWLAEGASD
jgi:hypothetical protein